MKILSSGLYKRNIRVDPRRPLVKTPFLSEISMIEDKYLIFSPVFGRIYLQDEEAYGELKNSNIRKEMLDAGFFINRGMNVIPQSQRPKKLSHMTIFLTGSCNLRCRYCYARGGEKPSFIDLDFVKAAVNQFTDKTKKNIKVSLHGGGEPTLAIDRIKQIDEFLKSQFDKVQYNIQTNGVMDEETLDWVLNNIKGITVSIDGPPYIQDKQRPMVGNKPSSPFVEKTVKRLIDERGKKISTRSTITKFSVEKQTEIVEYFHNLGISNAQLESLTECGRCLDNMNIYNTRPDFNVYIKNFFNALELAEDYGIGVFSTGISFKRFTSRFCGASGTNLCLTTDGYISACYEAVSGTEGPDVFIYGKYDKKNGKIIIDDNKLNYLCQRRVQNMPDCQNCFMKWNCGGSCNARAVRATGDMYKPDKKTCEQIRRMGKEFLKYRAKKDMLGIKPVLSRREKKVSFIFSDMKIKETFDNNDLEGASLINIDLDSVDLEKLSQQIIETKEKNLWKPTLFVLSFILKEKYLNSLYGKRIIKFLDELKKNRVYYKIATPLPRCMFLSDYKKMVKEYKIPFFQGQYIKTDFQQKSFERCKTCGYKTRGECLLFRDGRMIG